MENNNTKKKIKANIEFNHKNNIEDKIFLQNELNQYLLNKRMFTKNDKNILNNFKKSELYNQENLGITKQKNKYYPEMDQYLQKETRLLIKSNNENEFEEIKKDNKIEFINELIKDDQILESIEEDALLASTKYLFEHKKYKKCVNLCLKALRLKKYEKINYHLYYFLAICFYANEKYKLSSKYMCLAIEDGIPFASFYYIAAHILESNLDTYDKCLAYLKLLKRRKKTSPNCVDSQIKLAQFFTQIKDFKNAITEYEELYQNNRSNEYLFNLALLYIEESNNEKLGEVFLKIARNIKEEIGNQENNKDKEELEETLNKCINYYLESFKLNPKNIEIILELSEIHRAIDKHKDALGFIDLAMKINKNDYRIYYEGFLIYDEIGDMHTAKEMIKLCLILNISFIKGYNTLGNLLRKEKLYDEALKVFMTALLREPENVQLLNNLGNCYLEMGIRAKAKKAYLQAFALNENLFEVNCNLATIFKKEYDYNRAITHILKASQMEPLNPQVLSILSSIYREAGWYNTSIKSCLKALEQDPGNSVAYIQLAHSYKANKMFKEAKDCCIYVLDTHPKLNETYLIYLECVLFLGEWNSWENNKNNIRVLAEYQLQKNIINTNIPPIISDYYIDDLALKSWIFNKYSIQDYLLSVEYLNSNKDSEEDHVSEIKKSNKRIKNVKNEVLVVGYIIDKIEDYFTLFYLLLLRSSDKNIKTYIIVYESSQLICDLKDKDSFIIFNTVEHPIFKADHLKSYDLDLIIFFENLCSEIYDNITIRKINQLLTYKPAPLIISFPYNGITRSEKIFDYLILNSNVYHDENRILYQEKLIVCDKKSLIVSPEVFWTGIKNKDLSYLLKLNNMDEIELKEEIEKFNFPNEIFFGNLSQPYKIKEKTFLSWIEILKNTSNTKLILKYSNDIQVENFKINAEKNRVSGKRLIFVKMKNHNDYIDTMKNIDIYLDINYINCEDKLKIALYLNVPSICFVIENDHENVLNNFAIKYLLNSNIKNYAKSYEEYVMLAIENYKDLCTNFLNIGYTRIKKIELVENIKNFFKMCTENNAKLFEPANDFPFREIYKFHFENKGDSDIVI